MNDEMSPQDDLEKRLKEEAADFTLQPSPEAWSGITGQLPHGAGRRYRFWWAAAALLLGGGYLFLHQPDAIRKQGNLQPSMMHADRPAQQQESNPANTPDHALSINPSSPKIQQATAAKQKTSSEKKSLPGRENEPLNGASIPAVSPVNSSPAVQSPILDQTNFTLPYLASAAFRSKGIGSLTLSGAEATVAVPLNPQPITYHTLKPALVGMEEVDPKVQPSKVRRHLHWEAYFTPGISYRQWNHVQKAVPSSAPAMPAPPNGPTTQGNSVAPNPQNMPNLDHKVRAGWNAGVGISMPLNMHWALESGLRFSQLGYRIKAYRSYSAYVQSNRSPSFALTSSTNSRFTALARAAPPAEKGTYIRNRYYYGEIPLMLRLDYGQAGRWAFYTSAGGSLAFLLDAKASIYAPESGRYFTNPDKLNSLNTFLNLQTGITTPLGKGLRLNLGPSLQYQLLSTYKRYPQVKEHPWLLGLHMGMEWGK